jgi:uncharacterized protein
MTPQEGELIRELFDRLTSLEGAPRDGEAERAIAAGLARAPHAIYPLVQTVLVQDEALKRANARIQELENAGGSEEARGGGSFLENMRGAVFGRDAGARGSVPAVSPTVPSSGPYEQPPSAYAAAPGGSFLGTAAASAAGIIGGSLLLDGIRSMFGRGHAYAGAYEPVTQEHSPWDNRNPADSDMARQAGVDDVSDSQGHERSAGLFDTADSDDSDDDYADNDFDGGGYDDDGDIA